MIPREYGFPMNKLIIRVLKTQGTWPVLTVGDGIVIDEGYKLSFEETHNICIDSSASIASHQLAVPERTA